MPRTINPPEEIKEISKCQNKYPCGGCVPNPPHDCPYDVKNRCGAPCQDAIICHKLCHNLHCKAYKDYHELVTLRRREDTRIWNASHKGEEPEVIVEQPDNNDWEETVSALTLRRTLPPPEEI